jgi:hypothetical protein
MMIKPERRSDTYTNPAATYLLDGQVRELAFLKIRPVVTQLDIRDAEDVADHVPVHLLGPGAFLKSGTLLLLRRLLLVRLALDWGCRSGSFGHDVSAHGSRRQESRDQETDRLHKEIHLLTGKYTDFVYGLAE